MGSQRLNNELCPNDNDGYMYMQQQQHHMYLQQQQSPFSQASWDRLWYGTQKKRKETKKWKRKKR